MSVVDYFKSLFGKKVVTEVIETPAPKKRIQINPALVDRMIELEEAQQRTYHSPYKLPTYPPGVGRINSGTGSVAMDAAPNNLSGIWEWAANAGEHGMFAEGIGFLGYPYLAELSQRSEYKQPCEIIAEEMTRKWIVIKANGDDDKSDRINDLTDAMTRLRLREAVRDAMEKDGVFGLSFIYPDLVINSVPVWDNPAELKTPLLIDKAKIAKKTLKGFRVLDPTWMAPTDYNSNNPLDPTFFRPQRWFEMGREIHITRLLQIISRPVPDILKPTYNFGGLSLIQWMKPYVENWLRTRQAVSDLVNSFTLFVLKTDMGVILSGDDDGSNLDARINFLSQWRNNRGTLAIDKDREELENISASLATLDALQAQAQEQMASVARIPLNKLFGITPKGLNPSLDGDIRVFYDSIHAMQEKILGYIIKRALDIIQLSEFGEIDEDIVFEFCPLWELDEAGKAEIQKIKIDSSIALIDSGQIDPAEGRQRLADDPESDYANLEGPPPEPLDLDESDSDKDEGVGKSALNGKETGANSGV